MKVYLFYLRLTQENEINFHLPNVGYGYIVDNGDTMKELLYGYTKNKDLKNIFKETRDMSLFRIEKVDMSYEDYVLFVDKYSSVGHYGSHSLKTKTTVDGRFTVKMQDIYCTEFEYNECIALYPFGLNDTNPDYIYDLVDVSDNCFKGKYRDIMDKLISNTYLMNKYEDYNLDELAFDEMSIYTKVFGKTYRKDLMDENLEVL